MAGCKKCRSKHHTLLHRDKDREPTRDSSGYLAKRDDTADQIHISTTTGAARVSENVILSTAVVDVLDYNGRVHQARALLDNGSQSSFVTKNLCEKLQLPTTSVNYLVAGISNLKTYLDLKCSISLGTKLGDFKHVLNCLVILKITDKLTKIKYSF